MKLARGQVGEGTWGQGGRHGRDAIAPLPSNSGDMVTRGHGDKGRGKILKQACKGGE